MTCFALGAISLWGQTKPSDAKQRAVNTAQAKSAGAPTSPTLGVVATPQRTDSDSDHEAIKDLSIRVERLELGERKPKDSSENLAAWVAIIVAFISLAGGLIGQSLLARREDRRATVAAERAADLAKDDAVFKQTEKILDFRLQQMEHFYGPMFALLRQSLGLYYKMLHQLARDESTRYRWTPQPELAKTDYRFQVLDKKGEWQGFRLLDQFPAIRANPKALALAEGILDIGEKMTKIISQHAGLPSGRYASRE